MDVVPAAVAYYTVVEELTCSRQCTEYQSPVHWLQDQKLQMCLSGHDVLAISLGEGKTMGFLRSFILFVW